MPYFNLTQISKEFYSDDVVLDAPTYHQVVHVPKLTIPKYEFVTLSEPSYIDEINTGLPIIYGWIMRSEKVHMELVYRGTKHGFDLDSLHQQLDGKSPLMFFVKSKTFNQVFGGYTSCPWTTPENDSQFYYDHNAYIFQLNRKTKHLPFQHEHNAVQHYKKGALFGFGWGDIGIQENCDQRDDNYSNYGCTKWTKYTYRLPRHLNENSDEAYRWLAGEHQFRVLEIEVYQVQFIPK